MAAPLRLPGQAELRTTLALCSVFFWSLFRPTSMPPTAVFAIGMLSDLLGCAPVGVGVLTLMATHGVAVRAGRALARHVFLLVWLAFSVIASGGAALGWALTSALDRQLLSPGPGIFQTALSAGLYPLLAMLLTRAHNTLAEPERA